MSITSPNNQKLQPEFVDLLTNYAGLAGWLSNSLYRGKEAQAEKLLPAFLAECANQGVPENAYPFTVEDQGLVSLRIYLQRAWDEIEAFASVPTPRRAEPVSASDERDALPEKRSTDAASTTEMPVKGDLHGAFPASNPGEAGWEKDGETQPVVEEDVADLATMLMPAAPLFVVGESKAIENDADNQGSDRADPVGKSDGEGAALSGEPVPVATPAAGEGVKKNATDQRQSEIRVPVEGKEDIVAPVAGELEDDGAKDKEGEQLPPTAPAARRMGIRISSRRRVGRTRRARTRRQRIIARILLILILAAILVPSAFLVNFGISAYTTYHQLSDQAHSAVNHLLDVKNAFSGGKSHLSGIFDPTKLQRAQQDFVASGHDFQQLQQQLQQSSTLRTVTTYFPQYRETLRSVQAASQIGIDVAAIGKIATAQAVQLAPSFSGSLLAATGKPLVTQSLLDTIDKTIDQVMPLLNDVEIQSYSVSLDSLPISASEKSQVGQLLQLLPQTITDLSMVRSLMGEAGWLLGVNQPRTFLVQTMDRAELRGTGGFTGQYGDLTINGGRVAPFSLKDISLVEYTNTSVTQGKLAPEQYRSWWPFANWGLRDSNVSADFPTAARLAINLYQQETGNHVDGIISFTPVLVEHILSVIGSVQVPGYNVTVTAQNLEDLLHYYQLNNSGILKQVINQPNNNLTSTRKRFTNYLTTLVMDKVRSAQPNQLLALAHQVLYDLQSKDLQAYFTDPATENVLTQYGYAGQLDRSTTHDGFYVVQENLSASKASQYVQTVMHDTVTLDKQGGATHLLQFHLVYNQAGPVYGYDTYYDYVRVYVPSNSTLLYGDGFASGTPLCGGSYGDCPLNGVYPGDELKCPAGQYQPGASPPSLMGSDGGTWEPLQTVGAPTNTASDEPGRAMYGGWVVVPKNCTMNVTLSWYVPKLSAQPYSLLVQRQAGTFPELDLSILPDAADCANLGTTGLHFNGILVKDSSFTVPAYHAQGQQHCYPRQGV